MHEEAEKVENIGKISAPLRKYALPASIPQRRRRDISVASRPKTIHSAVGAA
jgi:hypothetical protein